MTSLNKTTLYPNIRHLVLSGGGLLGISYVGLLRYLHETGIFPNVKTITGCSAGAIFGSLMAVGYNADDMEVVIKNMNFKSYVNITADSILNFMKTKGLESGNGLINFIKKHIKDKTGDEDITFSQIREKYNIELRIGVTNLTKHRFEMLTYQTKPHLPIHRAIQASCAIPFVFEPVIIDDDVYCDGGLLDNLPIENITDCNIVNLMTRGDDNEDNCEDNKVEVNDENKDGKENKYLDITTLAVYLMNQPDSLTKANLATINLNNYLSVLTRTMSKNLISCKMDNINNNKRTKLIIFEIPCDIMTFIKVNATKEDIENIIQIAYDKSKEEFENSENL